MQKPNEEGKKPAVPPKRSRFGSLVLLGTILLLIFLVLNETNQKPQTELTQDRFEYSLLRGDIKKLEFHGPSRVTGEYWPEDNSTKPVAFTASFHDLTDQATRIQQLAAAPRPKPATMSEFLDKVGYTETEEGLRAKEEGDTTAPKKLEPLKFNVIYASLDKPTLNDRQLLVEGIESGKITRYLIKNPDLHHALEVRNAFRIDENQGIVRDFPTWSIHNFDRLKDGGTRYKEDNNLLTQLLVSFAPWFLILLVFYFFIIRQMRNPGGGGGILSFGRSRAMLYTKENRTNVTFDDVAGIEEAKDEVGEIVEFLKNPQRFQRLGGRIPRGILLAGPPGTGKTLLAKAIAGEAEVPFFSISGSDFVEMFVGVGASRVRDLFRQAKENSPCIVFLDEIDAVGRKRGSGLGGGHDEREQTLNAILVEMDGFDTDDGVIVVAATNRPDVLDTALLRPGRFDREIMIDPPDVAGREKILKVHSRRVKIGPNIDWHVIAQTTPGYSGADLAAVINEAAIIAVMKDHELVQQDDLEEAREKVRFGRQKKSRRLAEEDKRITSYHESGHALVATVLEDAEPVHKVTIVPRGMALGATMTLPERERIFMQRNRLYADLAVLYGGRIAEQIFCTDITAGAQNDIQRATQIARLMVCEWGMSQALGPVSYAERQGHDFLGTELAAARNYSEETAKQIDTEVRAILQKAYDTAERILSERHEIMHRMAEALLKYETITGAEVEALIAGQDIDAARQQKIENEQTPPPVPQPTEKKRPEVGAEEDPGLTGSEGLSPA